MIRSLLSAGTAGAGSRPTRRLSRLASMREHMTHVIEHDQHDEPHEQHGANHVYALLDALVDAPAGDQLVGQESEPAAVERRHWEQIEETEKDGEAGNDEER